MPMEGNEDILKKALAGNGKEETLSAEALMAYLEGTLSPEEQHKVERALAEEGLESDAIDGLKTLDSKTTRATVKKLNNDLKKNLAQTGLRRRKTGNSQTTLIAVVLVLFLAVVAYLVLHLLIKAKG